MRINANVCSATVCGLYAGTRETLIPSAFAACTSTLLNPAQRRATCFTFKLAKVASVEALKSSLTNTQTASKPLQVIAVCAFNGWGKNVKSIVDDGVGPYEIYKNAYPCWKFVASYTVLALALALYLKHDYIYIYIYMGVYLLLGTTILAANFRQI